MPSPSSALEHPHLAGPEDAAAPEHEGHRSGLRGHASRLVARPRREPAQPRHPPTHGHPTRELRSPVCRDIPSGRPEPTRRSATTPGRRRGCAGWPLSRAAPRWCRSSRSARTSWSSSGWSRPARPGTRPSPSAGRWRRPTRRGAAHTGALRTAGAATAGSGRSASCSPCRCDPVADVERVLRPPAARGDARPGPAARASTTSQATALFEKVAARVASGELDTGEPPSRLHGDLWAGNVVWTAARRRPHRPGRARRSPRGGPRVPRPVRRAAPRRDPRRLRRGRTARGRLAGAGTRCTSCTR